MYTIITNKEVAKRIASIRKRGKQLDSDIHETAIQTLLHAEQHGDLTLASNLISAMPKSSRRKALITWYKEFAPVQFNEKEEKLTKLRGKQAEDKKFMVASADQTPFWDLTEEKEVKPVSYDSLVQMVANLNKQVNRRGILPGDEKKVTLLINKLQSVA